MNADEVVRALKECGDCDNCPYYSCWIDEETGDPADACNDGRLFKDILSLIESLQAQLAKEKRRADKAVKDLMLDSRCTLCKHHRSEDGDCFGVSMCAVNGIKTNWEWRGDGEEGDAE